MPPLGDIIGLLCLAGIGLAIWLGRRRGSARVAAAVAAARAEGYAAAESAVYARIGSSVVVNNSNVGDGRGAIHATRHDHHHELDHDHDDRTAGHDYDHDDRTAGYELTADNGAAAYDDDTRGLDYDDRAAAIIRRELSAGRGRVPGVDRLTRAVDGVPVGLRADGRDRTAHTDRTETLNGRDRSW